MKISPQRYLTSGSAKKSLRDLKLFFLKIMLKNYLSFLKDSAFNFFLVEQGNKIVSIFTIFYSSSKAVGSFRLSVIKHVTRRMYILVDHW